MASAADEGMGLEQEQEQEREREREQEQEKGREKEKEKEMQGLPQPAISGPASLMNRPIDSDSFHSSDGSESLDDLGATISLISTVRRFQKENGRTYHGYRAGTYYFPNDPTEAERLDFQYALQQFALDDIMHFAPLSAPLKMLDIGTGTGIWAIQMGDLYPEAIVEGTDLSPIQPDNVPENVHFIIDNAEQEDWAVPEDYYDYIHTRVLMGCFQDFKTIIKQGFRHTKPGGWMESQEVMHPPFCEDGTMPEDWPFKDWSEHIEDAAKDIGRPLRTADKLKRWYIEAGFVDVQEKVIKLPINSWPRNKKLKMLGRWWAENLLIGLQGFSLALLSRVYGWSKDEIEIYLIDVRKAIKNHRVHAFHKYYIVWGRKPDSTSDASADTAMPAVQMVDSIQPREDLISEEHGSRQAPTSTLVLPSNEPAHNSEPQISNLPEIRASGIGQD